jgi:hypothetical protein
MRSVLRLLPAAALLALLVAAPGCSEKAEKPAGGAKKAAHDHPDKGPHGGPLVEWGDEDYHVEFTVDRAAKRATVYILDGSARKSAPIAADAVTLTLMSVQPPAQITLKPDPQADDPKGQSSRFSGVDERLAAAELEGELSTKIAGTPFSGSLKDRRGKR